MKKIILVVLLMCFSYTEAQVVNFSYDNADSYDAAAKLNAPESSVSGVDIKLARTFINNAGAKDFHFQVRESGVRTILGNATVLEKTEPCPPLCGELYTVQEADVLFGSVVYEVVISRAELLYQLSRANKVLYFSVQR